MRAGLAWGETGPCWKVAQELDEREINNVEREIGPLLARLGYA
jgi:hypothetical protein